MKVLSDMLGKRLSGIKRRLFCPDHVLPSNLELADGFVELRVDVAVTLHVRPDTKRFGISIHEGSMPDDSECSCTIDVSTSDFWRHRIDRVIQRVTLFVSRDKIGETISGIGLYFDNAPRAVIQYVASDPLWDSLCIADQLLEKSMILSSIEVPIGGSG